jgi:hypothetical protein
MVVIFTHWQQSLINIALGKSIWISFQPNKQNYQKDAIESTAEVFSTEPVNTAKRKLYQRQS